MNVVAASVEQPLDKLAVTVAVAQSSDVVTDVALLANGVPARSPTDST